MHPSFAPHSLLITFLSLPIALDIQMPTFALGVEGCMRNMMPTAAPLPIGHWLPHVGEIGKPCDQLSRREANQERKVGAMPSSMQTRIDNAALRDSALLMTTLWW